MPSLHVFPLDNLVLSTGLIMWIGHRKEIRKLMFHELALRRSESAPNYLVILPADAAHGFFTNLPLLFMFFQVQFSDFVVTKRDTQTNDVKHRLDQTIACEQSQKSKPTRSLGQDQKPPPYQTLRSAHPTPSPHLFPKTLCLSVPSGANCRFVAICFTLVMTFLG